MIQHSEQIGEIAKALSVAQGQFLEIQRDAYNPFFKSKYADLASVLRATRPALSSNGLSIINGTEHSETNSKSITISMMLMHSSGQWLKSSITIASKSDDAQSIGSVITYGRRYLVGAMLSVASEDDDDGNAASDKSKQQQQASNKAPDSLQVARDKYNRMVAYVAGLENPEIQAEVKKIIKEQSNGRKLADLNEGEIKLILALADGVFEQNERGE